MQESQEGSRNWIFFAKIKAAQRFRHLDLYDAGYTPIKRHIKIRKNTNIYDPAFNSYLHQREKHKIKGKTMLYKNPLVSWNNFSNSVNSIGCIEA